MLTRIIHAALDSRWLVLLGAVLIAAGGYVGLTHINIDAFPDTTPVQVQINTVAPAMVATEIERLITFPIELSLGGMPGVTGVRSLSQFGLSQVTVTFEDGTDIYMARQIILERLSRAQFPPGLPRPQLGPIATGLGEVLHYHVKTDGPDGMSMIQLRTTQDWEIRPELRPVPGVAEINTWGGLEKQYQVRVDPDKLVKYDLTLARVLDALREGNTNVGGGYIDREGDMLLIHGIARTVTVEQIGNIVVASTGGVPVYVKDLAEVVVSHDIRRGMVTANGEGEVVLGLGFMRIGSNSYTVTKSLREQLDKAVQDLPPGVKVDLVYDRTELVDQVIATVRANLCEGALLVVVLLFLFLGNLRAGLIAAVTIPLAMLFAFIGMWPAGIAGTLLSLGAIDFGIVVDSSVVMLENIMRRLAHAQAHGDPENRSRLEIIKDAANEVRVPTVFGQIIILIVYIPILTLEGVEGKMFRPMAYTVMLVLTGSLVLALTLTPVLASFLLPKRVEEKEAFLVRAARWVYRPVLGLVMRARLPVLAGGAAALAITGAIAAGMGTEFVPQLSEGALVIGALRVPGTSIEQSAAMNTQMEKYIKANYPEVKDLWSRAGEPEINTDAGAPESTDIYVTLKPKSEWRPHIKTQGDLVMEMSKDLKRFKGQVIWFTQPIEMRVNEMLTGSRSDLSLKLFGDDIDTLVEKGAELQAVLQDIPGCADLSIEQVKGQPILQVRLKQDELARYGVTAEAVLENLEAVSGKPVGMVIEDQLRFGLAVRLPDAYRDTPEAITNLTVLAPTGERLPLSRLADIREVRGPKLIASEWGKRRVTVQCNVRGRDIGSFVAEAQRAIDAKVQLPQGFRVEWGGQFENMVRAQQRLMIVVPLALLMIVSLLYLTYRSAWDTAFVFASVPFACVGGIAGLWLRGMPLSISAAVGFITLSGVSVLNSMIVVSNLRARVAEGLSPGEAIRAAWLGCLRTVMMTALVASVGFIPMATSSGTGAEVQRPLATVVIGGVITSGLMTLVLLPALYACVPFVLRRPAGAEPEPTAPHAHG
jgi:cobalt-zinc-cadmium resistance protein CzcA